MKKAMRFNDGKPRWGLVHFKSLIPLVRVLEFGTKKYVPGDWKNGLDKQEILESAFRHLISLMDGEEYDNESGISHIGHIMANMMFYQYERDKEDI